MVKAHEGREAGRRRTDDVDIDHQELERWCCEYATSRSSELRSRILEHHDWLVRVCAKQMLRRGEALDDLVQVGNIGLMKALDRFDPSFDVRFRTFASVTIDGELRRYYRSSWRIHVPRSVQERHHAVNRAVESLTASNQSAPSVHDVAGFLACSDRDVSEAMAAGAAFAPSALDASPGDSDRESVLSDTRSSRSFEGADQRLLLGNLLATLGERDRRVLFLRFFEDRTQVEIADELGISQVHVSRLLRRALDRLRRTALDQDSFAPLAAS